MENIVAVVLLILIAVTACTLLYLWFISYLQKIFLEIEDITEKFFNKTRQVINGENK